MDVHTPAFGGPHRRRTAYTHIWLPTLTCGCIRLHLACQHRRGQAYAGVWCVQLRWPAHIIHCGSPGLPMLSWGFLCPCLAAHLLVLCDWQREWAPTFVVAHFRDLLPASHFTPPSSFPLCINPPNAKMTSPHPWGEGRGTQWAWGPWWERGEAGGRRWKWWMKPTSTVDAVDVGFKLRSHTQ